MTREEFAGTLRFGGWEVVFVGISGILSSADRFIVGWIAGAGATALYAIPMSLSSRLQFLPQGVLRSLFPRLSEVREDAERQELGTRALIAMLAGMAIITIPAILFVRPFFEVWLGMDFEATSGLIAQILLLGVYVDSCLRVLFVLQRACGRPDLPARLRLVTAVPKLGLLLVFIWLWGAVGAAIAMSSTFLVELLWVLHNSGLTRSVLAALIGYASLCAIALAFAALGYGLLIGAAAALVAMLSLAALACWYSPDLAGLVRRLWTTLQRNESN